jgi:hypothetical protein
MFTQGCVTQAKKENPSPVPNQNCFLHPQEITAVQPRGHDEMGTDMESLNTRGMAPPTSAHLSNYYEHELYFNCSGIVIEVMRMRESRKTVRVRLEPHQGDRKSRAHELCPRTATRFILPIPGTLTIGSKLKLICTG